ncbi:MAG: MFS transporter [Trueperaceae bacterium]|nr:MFS transporter [Trueperaceae bacterium]
MNENGTNSRWIILLATSIGGFIGSIMFTSVNVAIPSMMKAFGAEFNVIQWVVLSYLLATCTFLPIVGRLADMLGKKSLYIAGYAIFTLGSLLCGIAPNVPSLIALRAVQGFGSAFITALGLAIITDVFPAKERGKAIGISGSILSVGVVMGPTLGGLLADALSWRWVFLIAFVPGLLGMILGLRFIPAYKRKYNQSFDFLGAGLLFVTLLSLLLALTFGQDRGFLDGPILILFALSLVAGFIFVRLERRTAEPILNMTLFQNRQLSLGLITGFITFISISGTIFLMPFYLTNILGLSARNVGLLMSIGPIALVICAPLAGFFADRFGERPVTVIGMLSLFIGYLMLGGISETTTVWEYLLRFLPVGIGMGVFQTPNNSAIMGAVDKAFSGVAGGLLALTRSLGSTAGIAVLGTLWAVRVSARASTPIEATEAPFDLQILGLHDLFLSIQIFTFIGLLLMIGDWVGRLRTRQKVVGATD